MNLAGMQPKGYEENVTIDEGVNADGVNTKLHFEGDFLTVQKTYDATPHLEYAASAREQTSGMNWGQGRLVGHIPPLEYAKFSMIKDAGERQKAIHLWLKENSAFVMFDRFLK